ncbi:cora-like Mg2+ transporter protein-domain-containing protein [Bisporella sp. PMI_857]|nr:cora-like Mg2+ transporter protein-domain-containing protein [Bisporella sp. PMI_857]
MNIRERFMEQLEKCNGKDNLSSLRSTIQNIIIQMIVTDSGTILSSLNEALDEIDLSMSQDDILRGSLGEWRNNFGRWRTGLQHQQASLAYVRRVLEAEEPSSKPKGDFVGVVEISDLESGLAATQKRVDGTFQVLMSTMSIIESQKAIAQAETVSKLTYLAFFFIPPTFVTGIFGMNIVEFVGKLKVWIWVTVSLGVSTLAYIFLFWSEIAANARHTPNLVSLNRRRMSAWVAKWFRTIYYLVAEVLVVIFPLALSLGFLAGFGVGLWKLYTSHLSAGAKAGISVAIFLPMLAALIFPLYLQKS